MLVLDASIALAWALPDEDRDGRAFQVLQRHGGDQALVPGHWRTEVGNGVLMAFRRSRLPAKDVPLILAQVDRLGVEVDTSGTEFPWGEPLKLALATGLTIYDALYLELALRRGLALASCDAALRAAARSRKVKTVPTW